MADETSTSTVHTDINLGLAGPVTEGLKLANTLASWLFGEDGYVTWTRERKIKELHDGILMALQERHFDIADRFFAQLKQLSKET